MHMCSYRILHRRLCIEVITSMVVISNLTYDSASLDLCNLPHK